MNSTAGGAPATYIVLSHRAPAQVARLVGAILRSSPAARVVVHHDARREAPPEIADDRVFVSAHHRRADWGSWEIVAATLDALRTARDVFDPGMVVLISGQDYPALNLAEWEQHFRDEGRMWSGTARPLVYRARWGRPQGEGDDDLTRYTHRWYRVPFARFLTSGTTTARRLAWPLWKVGHYFEPLVDVRAVTRGRGLHIGIRGRRSGPGRAPYFKGSQWWAMDRRLVDEVLDRAGRDRRLVSAYKRSIIPDESFFQSIVAPGHEPSGDPVTYVQWVVEDDAPRILDRSDLEAVLASGSPFCRKVEQGVSDALMDQLDSRTAPPSG